MCLAPCGTGGARSTTEPTDALFGEFVATGADARIVTLRDGWAKVSGVAATAAVGTVTAKGTQGR